LENWPTIVAPLEAGLDQLARVLAEFPPHIILAALAVPVVLALISGRLLGLLTAALLAVVAFMVLYRPALADTTVALASYAGSVLVALWSLSSRWRGRALRNEVAALRAQIDQLAQSESRRVLADLKSGSDAAQNAVRRMGE